MRISIFALCLIFCACQRPAPKRPPTAEAPARPSLPPELAGMQMPPPPDETRPVYPTKLTGAPEPLALAYCQILHGLPASRRLACCGGPPGIVLTDDCVRTVTYALRDRAISLDAEALSACSRDMQAALTGCDFIGPTPLTLPESCRGVVRGTLAAGARCRSSLECGGSLYCKGVGPVSPGTCGPPRRDGEPCALSVDPLAAFTRQDRLERQHPECAGFCGRAHRCQPTLPVGAKCVMSSQCGAAGRCGRGVCVAGPWGSEGEACADDDCAPGLRCNQFQCQKPKLSGAECREDAECLGGCDQPGATPFPGTSLLIGPGPGVGKCAPKCSNAR